MDKAHGKRISGISVRLLLELIVSVVFLGFYCTFGGNAIKVRADSQFDELQFYVGGDPKGLGVTIDYTSEGTAPMAIQLFGAPTGATYDWKIIDTSIVDFNGTHNTDSISLKIKSPGYTGLSVTVEAPDGEKKEAYCDIHVPLEWDDNNNIKYRDNSYGYGILYANDEDSTGDTEGKKYTLQLFTSDSAITDTQSERYCHYLRKLKHIDYFYNADDPNTPVTAETTATRAKSDITPGYLADYGGELKWESSNRSVIDVDDQGIIIAKAAGFATVTVTTKAAVNGKRDMLSFDVIVMPEVKTLNGSNGVFYLPDDLLSLGSADFTKVISDFKGTEAILNTNSKRSSDLEWHIYRENGTEVTDSVISLSEVDGSARIQNIKAGTYLITAVPKKVNSEISTASYNPFRTHINVLRYKIIVPIEYPQESVTLAYFSSSFYDNYDILEDSNIPAGMFNYTIQNIEEQKVARIGSREGLVEAVSRGEATVSILQNTSAFNTYYGQYALSNNLTGYDPNREIKVTVYGGVLLNTSLASIPIGGEPFQLELVGSFDGQVEWESENPSIATVTDGKITARGIGETTITAILTDENNHKRRVQCIVKVVASINSISLSTQSDHINVNESMLINATVDPSSLGGALVWSVSDTSIAEVSPESGISVTIIGKKPGTVAVTARNPANGKFGTIVVTINPVITRIDFDPAFVTVSSSSGPIQLFANCTPGLPYGETLNWYSSDESIAKTDQNGKVTVKKAGTVWIYAEASNGIRGYCTVTVLQEMEGIVFDKNELLLYSGESKRLTYTINPSTTSDTTLKWSSSDVNVATVTNNGLITAVNSGTCTITAQSQDGSNRIASCLVSVIKDATGIFLDVASLNLSIGESYQLDAEVEPAGSTNDLFYESSNDNVAVVNSTGKITGKGKGNCVVFVKTGTGVYAYCYVSVSQQVTGLELDRETAEMHVGELLELTATISPKGASDSEIEWESSNTSVATVSEKGIVKAIAKGAALIKCTSLDGDYMDYCLVTVAEGTRTVTITVNKTATVGVGKKYQLTATVDGEEVPANTLKWKSSNKKICTVTKNGVIKGIKTGKCKITVKMKDGSVGSAKCTVRVINATDDIELNKDYVEIVQGRTLKLKATTKPKTTTYSPIWESSDENIATVSKKGTVTALKPGDCIIKCVAKDNSEVYAVCRVHVTAPVSITSFNFSEDAIVMFPGEKTGIQYTVSPSNYTEGYTWSSDNPVAATVDSNGKVTAKAVGSAKITALSDSGKKSTMNVYVVGLSKTKITLHQYESTKISLQVDGVKKGELDIRWDTDNQSIAEMSNGKVTGKALGTTTVYCVVNGRYMACTVKVIKN